TFRDRPTEKDVEDKENQEHICEQIQYGVIKIRKMSTISVNCQFNKYDVNKISVKPEENCKRISGKDRKIFCIFLYETTQMEITH
ncbi:MAG: hypothetical protein J6X27_02845, partial [Bacteroidaceae bacterium]|nr:hypothetical protein [Bacteroidaceae bacterium]